MIDTEVRACSNDYKGNQYHGGFHSVSYIMQFREGGNERGDEPTQQEQFMNYFKMRPQHEVDREMMRNLPKGFQNAEACAGDSLGGCVFVGGVRKSTRIKSKSDTKFWGNQGWKYRDFAVPGTFDMF